MNAIIKKLDWVDGIKAFAIIAILLNHFVESFGLGPWFSNPTNDWPEFSVRMTNIFPKNGSLTTRVFTFLGWLGDMGPGVFLLLSGLTLTISALNKPLKPFNFYLKRLLRIYPLYVFIHLVILIIAKYWFAWDIHFFSISTVLSLLGLRFTDSLFFYINPSWWFIWLLLQMYFLFPFLLVFLKNKGVVKFLLVTFVVTILSRLFGVLGLTYSKDLFFWMTGIFAGTRLFEFTFGMYVGYLLFYNDTYLTKLLSGKRKSLLISFCIYILGFIFSWSYVGSIFSNIFITIGLSGLFYSIFEIFFKNNNFLKNALLWIGKNSFSVFLLHQPFMMYAGPLMNGIPKGIILGVIIILSFFIGNVIEKIVIALVKLIMTNKQKINYFLTSKYYLRLVFLMLIITSLISINIMLGAAQFSKILKLLLFCFAVAILLFRILKKAKASLFVTQFLDVVLMISFLMLLITDNWLSTYWMFVGLSLIPLIFVYKFRPLISTLSTIFCLVAGSYAFEIYLKKNHPIEVIKWGELPALQADSSTVYSLIPNRKTHLKYNNYDYYVKTNSYGFTSPEINLTIKAENEKRILIIGDAFSMPEGLEYLNSYPYLLEKKLRESYPKYKINVIDAGVTGYGPNEELAQLTKYIKIVKPDIVINQFFINEFDDINILKEERLANIGLLSDRSIIGHVFKYNQTPLQLNILAQKTFGIVNRSNFYDKSLLPFYKKRASFYNDTVINKIRKYFNEMKKICSLNEARYLVMYVPGQIEVSNPKDIKYYPFFENIKDTTIFDFNQPQRIVGDLCIAAGVYYLNTTVYLKNYPIQPVYFTESWHWNTRGHEAIAKYLFDNFIANNLFAKL